MALKVVEINHVQVTVPKAAEEAAKKFYGEVLGLVEIQKPGESKKRGGAWYRHGALEIHLSIEDVADNHASRRHLCYLVADLTEAATELRTAGIEIIPDKQPMDGWARFYVRDPGGNNIEIAQRSELEV